MHYFFGQTASGHEILTWHAASSFLSDVFSWLEIKGPAFFWYRYLIVPALSQILSITPPSSMETDLTRGHKSRSKKAILCRLLCLLLWASSMLAWQVRIITQRRESFHVVHKCQHLLDKIRSHKLFRKRFKLPPKIDDASGKGFKRVLKVWSGIKWGDNESVQSSRLIYAI